MSAGRLLSAAVVALGLFGSLLPAYAELYPARPIKGTKARSTAKTIDPHLREQWLSF